MTKRPPQPFAGSNDPAWWKEWIEPGAVGSGTGQERGQQMTIELLSERMAALDFLLCFIVDQLHGGEIVISEEAVTEWRDTQISRRRWGGIVDANGDDDTGPIVLTVAWHPTQDIVAIIDEHDRQQREFRRRLINEWLRSEAE
jgi:hypothetical protein